MDSQLRREDKEKYVKSEIGRHIEGDSLSLKHSHILGARRFKNLLLEEELGRQTRPPWSDSLVGT